MKYETKYSYANSVARSVYVLTHERLATQSMKVAPIYSVLRVL